MLESGVWFEPVVVEDLEDDACVADAVGAVCGVLIEVGLAGFDVGIGVGDGVGVGDGLEVSEADGEGEEVETGNAAAAAGGAAAGGAPAAGAEAGGRTTGALADAEAEGEAEEFA